ncbi:MAG: DUF4124 domain-containing protein, partial [Nitrococcus sp.]|nr:DUF4124 domain-containing protein [Nitrococcus sp.]
SYSMAFQLATMRRIAASALFFLLAAPVAAAVVYKWTGENGVVHFSDKPHPGAKRVDVGEPLVYSPPPSDFEASATPKPSAAAPGYAHFSIVEPQPEATVRNNPGTVAVRFNVEPELREGDRIQLLLDGQPVATGGPTADTVALQQVNRGAHTLSALIKDKAGEVIARADPVTFYMFRPSVHIPANKPPRL